MASASRLFHTVVVIGTSMGCGSTAAAVAPTVTSEAGSRDASAKGDASSVQSLCDCARPGTFRCKACASGTMPILGRCPDNDGIDCACDESIAVAAPTDCVHPEQFECAAGPGAPPEDGVAFGPTDWFAFANCTCDSTVPTMPSQCDGEQFIYRCAPPWSCQDGGAQTVAYGCACLPYPTPIK